MSDNDILLSESPTPTQNLSDNSRKEKTYREDSESEGDSARDSEWTRDDSDEGQEEDGDTGSFGTLPDDMPEHERFSDETNSNETYPEETEPESGSVSAQRGDGEGSSSFSGSRDARSTLRSGSNIGGEKGNDLHLPTLLDGPRTRALTMSMFHFKKLHLV